MNNINIVALAGSLKKESQNKKLAQAAANIALEAGACVQIIHLEDYDLPLFSEDIEGQLSAEYHDNLQQLRKILDNADGFIMASPEYNGMVPGVFKNTLDWISRSFDDGFGNVFADKPLALMSASPGANAGMRGLFSARDTFYFLGSLILPNAFGLGRSHSQFNQEGNLTDENTNARLTKLVTQLVKITNALKD
jgi:chromate reductase, NAD(P)H dehydrogenase (quinone)